MDRLQLKDLNFGSISAEQEITIDSGKFLTDVFQDPFNCLSQIKEGKIFILGRKGTGKSMIASYIDRNKNANTLHRQIRFSASNLEEIIQLPALENNKELQRYLWEWLLLCNFGQMIVEDNSIRMADNDRENLKKFFERNRGFCSPDGAEIIETVRSSKIEVGTEYLNRVINANLNRALSVKENKAPFFKIIEPLKELLTKILISSVRDTSNCFFALVDDLDINYQNTALQKSALLGLLRSASGLYTHFNKEGVKFFPVVLLRNDMLAQLMHEADTRRFKEAFGQSLNWYVHHDFKKDELSVPLRLMISDRVRYSYKALGKVIDDTVDFWEILFEENDFLDGKPSFKHVIDFTLYRPRDLISLFNEIRRQNPKARTVTRTMIWNATIRYSEYMVDEWRNELGFEFTADEIDELLGSLSDISRHQKFSFQEFKEIRVKIKAPKFLDEELLEVAFLYGMICNIDENDHVNWKYRETPQRPAILNLENPMRTHTCLSRNFAAAAPRKRVFSW